MDTLNWSLMVVPGFKLNISTSPISPAFERQPIINVTTSTATRCSYYINNQEFNFTDYSGIHEQKHTENLPVGNNQIKVTCRDYAGNIIEKTTNYELKVDNVKPFITRVLTRNNILEIATSEKANCKYSPTKVPTNFDDTSLSQMLTDDQGIIHRAAGSDSVYRIICQDTFNNNSTISTVYP
jgi:hypothetical protein